MISTILLLKIIFILLGVALSLAGITSLIMSLDTQIRYLKRMNMADFGMKLIFAGVIIIAIMLNPLFF